MIRHKQARHVSTIAATVCLVVAGVAASGARPALAAAPGNDNLAGASVIGALPFSTVVDMTDATIESGEPTPSSPGSGTIDRSVWYDLTPVVSATYFASVGTFSCCWQPVLTVYTGSSVATLTPTPTYTTSPQASFHADAGTTYHIQIGTTGSPFFGPPTVTFSIDVAPPPSVDFGEFTSDPSIFDTVQFFCQTYDPAGVGFRSWTWTFSDGTTATGCFPGPSRQWTSDRDVTVTLTATTVDGRSASTSHTVQVRTHDVSIAKLVVPTSASVGQTRGISVGISDTRYPETVQVQLLKSVPGQPYTSFQPVGSLTQSLNVNPANKTTPFSFNYTFTAADGTAGKVTFEAIATILTGRDAQPADNTVIALATTVNSR
ncbi:MAG TPA: PKD domain-containing protein [Candidatus Dormibacteraeota bacterium]|nr:PKD domain-containing protein [Candidatus Dormibacteraeota bacterium]